MKSEIGRGTGDHYLDVRWHPGGASCELISQRETRLGPPTSTNRGSTQPVLSLIRSCTAEVGHHPVVSSLTTAFSSGSHSRSVGSRLVADDPCVSGSRGGPVTGGTLSSSACFTGFLVSSPKSHLAGWPTRSAHRLALVVAHVTGAGMAPRRAHDRLSAECPPTVAPLKPALQTSRSRATINATTPRPSLAEVPI